MFKNRAPQNTSLSEIMAREASQRDANKAKSSYSFATALNVKAPTTIEKGQDFRPILEEGKQLELNVFEVQLFEKNRRSSNNEKYEEIRQSMIDRVAQGLPPMKVSPHVTKRTANGSFVLEAGGNTRLMALRDLFEQTKDGVYATAFFVWTPYRGESTLITNHYLENNLRGSNTFWDTALQLNDLRQALMVELMLEQLPLRQFEELLVKRSIKLSRSQLSLYLSAIDRFATLQSRTELTQYTVGHLQQQIARVQKVWELEHPKPIESAPLQAWQREHDVFGLAILEAVDRQASESGQLSIDVINTALSSFTKAQLNLPLNRVESLAASLAAGEDAQALHAVLVEDGVIADQEENRAILAQRKALTQKRTNRERPSHAIKDLPDGCIAWPAHLRTKPATPLRKRLRSLLDQCLTLLNLPSDFVRITPPEYANYLDNKQDLYRNSIPEHPLMLTRELHELPMNLATYPDPIPRDETNISYRSAILKAILYCTGDLDQLTADNLHPDCILYEMDPTDPGWDPRIDPDTHSIKAMLEAGNREYHYWLTSPLADHIGYQLIVTYRSLLNEEFPIEIQRQREGYAYNQMEEEDDAQQYHERLVNDSVQAADKHRTTKLREALRQAKQAEGV